MILKFLSSLQFFWYMIWNDHNWPFGSRWITFLYLGAFGTTLKMTWVSLSFNWINHELEVLIQEIPVILDKSLVHLAEDEKYRKGFSDPWAKCNQLCLSSREGRGKWKGRLYSKSSFQNKLLLIGGGGAPLPENSFLWIWRLLWLIFEKAWKSRINSIYFTQTVNVTVHEVHIYEYLQM